MPWTIHRSAVAFAVLAMLGASPARGAEPVTVQVYAAASLADVFQALGHDLETTHPDLRFRFNLAGSQALAQQIRLGAPADVFAAADARSMGVVQAARPGTESRVFARNRLAIVVARSARQRVSKLADLARNGVRVVVADPTVPVGGYTRDMLAKASMRLRYGRDFAVRVARNVRSYETNVRLVRTKVALGEADAGIVYESDARGQDVIPVAVPAAVNVVAEYPIAVIGGASQSAGARRFVDAVLSPVGQRRLKQAGFIPVAGGP